MIGMWRLKISLIATAWGLLWLNYIFFCPIQIITSSLLHYYCLSPHQLGWRSGIPSRCIWQREVLRNQRTNLTHFSVMNPLANVLFLVLGNKIDISYTCIKRRVVLSFRPNQCHHGKGRVNLSGTNVRSPYVFMCSIVRKID